MSDEEEEITETKRIIEDIMVAIFNMIDDSKCRVEERTGWRTSGYNGNYASSVQWKAEKKSHIISRNYMIDVDQKIKFVSVHGFDEHSKFMTLMKVGLGDPECFEKVAKKANELVKRTNPYILPGFKKLT